MMATDGQDTTSLKEVLRPVLNILHSLGGYFAFRNEAGEEFILASRQEFERRQVTAFKAETQLALPETHEVPTSAEEVLDNINRELAIFELQQQEEVIDDLALDAPASQEIRTDGLRIRFEPLKGDLPPELQE
jgi:hypothetical protein